MNRVLYVSKSRLENTLEEYNTIYSSVTTWRSRMETQNSNIAASNEGATTETYTEKTTAYNDNELSDFSGHVNVMSCALVEALTKTRGLIARSEDFVNILKGESAESSDTYSNISSTGDVASYYDNFCSQEGFTGAIKDNTESITDLGIKEEENLTGIEDELKSLKTISVDISGYATHIRDCITKQNYTSPLYDSLRAYCIDVAVMHDYVKRIRDTYFPVLDGPREHNRSYNYDGAPTDDKENIYTSRIKELGFSERDIEVLKRYTGLTAEQLYNQLSHMPGAEIANMLKLAYANYGKAGNRQPETGDYATDTKALIAEFNLTDDQMRYITNLEQLIGKKVDDVDYTLERVCGMQVTAARLMAEGYSMEFIAGVLGNTASEGEPATLENVYYSKGCPYEYVRRLVKFGNEYYGITNFDEKFKGFHNNIYDKVDYKEYLEFINAYKATNPSDGKLWGIGQCQWTDSKRLPDMLDHYAAADAAGNNDGMLSFKEALDAESQMIIDELKDDSTLQGKVDNKFNTYTIDPNPKNNEAVVKQGALDFRSDYERSAHPEPERATRAWTIYQIMRGPF